MTADAHKIAHDAEYRLVHAIPRLTTATVHTEPTSIDRHDHHNAVIVHR